MSIDWTRLLDDATSVIWAALFGLIAAWLRWQAKKFEQKSTRTTAEKIEGARQDSISRDEQVLRAARAMEREIHRKIKQQRDELVAEIKTIKHDTRYVEKRRNDVAEPVTTERRANGNQGRSAGDADAPTGRAAHSLEGNQSREYGEG